MGADATEAPQFIKREDSTRVFRLVGVILRQYLKTWHEPEVLGTIHESE